MSLIGSCGGIDDRDVRRSVTWRVVRLGIAGKSLMARLLQEATAETIPWCGARWPVAVAAFTRFGKGRHPAALNFGDCLTYATCRLARRPLPGHVSALTFRCCADVQMLIGAGFVDRRADRCGLFVGRLDRGLVDEVVPRRVLARGVRSGERCAGQHGRGEDDASDEHADDR